MARGPAKIVLSGEERAEHPGRAACSASSMTATAAARCATWRPGTFTAAD